MGMIDAYCTVCGDILDSWLTESGDHLVVEPCKKRCSPDTMNGYETDEDFIHKYKEKDGE